MAILMLTRLKKLAIEFIDFFEKLVDMFRRLGKSLGRFEIHARLYPTSERLKESLIEAYEKFLDLCLKSKSVFAEKSSKRLKCSTGSAPWILVSIIRMPLNCTNLALESGSLIMKSTRNGKAKKMLHCGSMPNVIIRLTLE
jgi:hypothetical protein